MSFLKNIILTLIVVMLCACQPKEKSYADLLSHPNDLKQAVAACESRKLNVNYCEMVQRASQDFSGLYNEWQQGPEDFGKRILQLQMTDADLTLINKNNFSENLTQQQMIAAYLAVVGLNPVE